jgi:predicted nucleic acid-binding protein
VSVYLDASVLVALFTEDAFTHRADAFCRTNAPILVVSDFAAAEFSAVIARHVRTRDIIAEDARAVFSTFDVWAARATQRIEIDARVSMSPRVPTLREGRQAVQPNDAGHRAPLRCTMLPAATGQSSGDGAGLNGRLR